MPRGSRDSSVKTVKKLLVCCCEPNDGKPSAKDHIAAQHAKTRLCRGKLSRVEPPAQVMRRRIMRRPSRISTSSINFVIVRIPLPSSDKRNAGMPSTKGSKSLSSVNDCIVHRNAFSSHSSRHVVSSLRRRAVHFSHKSCESSDTTGFRPKLKSYVGVCRTSEYKRRHITAHVRINHHN